MSKEFVFKNAKEFFKKATYKRQLKRTKEHNTSASNALSLIKYMENEYSAV